MIHIIIDTICKIIDVPMCVSTSDIATIIKEHIKAGKVLPISLHGEISKKYFMINSCTITNSKRTSDLEIYNISNPFCAQINSTGIKTIKCKTCDINEKIGFPFAL